MKSQNEFEVDIKRTKRRKTISLKIIDGFVQIIVPEFMSDQEIELLITKKRKWIRDKLKIQKSIPSYQAKEFISGESFSYLGKNYRLKVKKGSNVGTVLKNGYFNVTVKPSQKGEKAVRQGLEKWFRDKALEKLKQKTLEYAEKLDVTPESVSVRDYKSRWGACSVNRDIIYNWRLIMVPHSIIDYVVIHELCHLKHHNHSKNYWKTVNSILPDYKKQRDWLKVNANLLKW